LFSQVHLHIKSMASFQFGFFAFLFLLPFVWSASISCKPTVAGRTYDLTPLVAKNGSYIWNSKWNGTNYWWQGQICGDVANPVPSCTHPAPMYQISQDKSQCTFLGETAVAAWDPNPYNDGIYLTYYHGATINNVQHLSARIYFVCTPGQVGTLSFEHVRKCTDPNDKLEYGGTYHFFVGTQYVC